MSLALSELFKRGPGGWEASLGWRWGSEGFGGLWRFEGVLRVAVGFSGFGWLPWRV